MIRSSNNKSPEFYVVQFRDLPFETIDNYVCVPYTWMIIRKEIGERAIVAYPENEDFFKIRDRVKRKERISDDWGFYASTVKYTTDSYRDAEDWIVTKKENESLVEKGLRTTDNEQKFPLNKESAFLNRTDLSKSNDNSQKPLPKISIKRPALLEPNQQHHGKRVKPDDAAQSSSAVVTDANAEPGSSRQVQLIISQNNQPTESAQTEKTASDSNDTSSSSQQKDDNHEESLPIKEQQKLSIQSIDVDTPTLVIDDDKEVQPTSAKEQQVPSYQAISQFTKQLEPIQEPQISVAFAKQNPSNLMEQTGSLSTCSVLTQQLYSKQSYHNQCIPTNQNSDSDTDTYHEVISDHEMSTEEAAIEGTNNFYSTGFTSESSRADRLIAAQTSTNYMTYSKVLLEQQILNFSDELFNNMRSYLRNTCDMFNNLRSLFLDSALTFKKLMDTDRLIASPSTGYQTHPKVLLEQQILNTSDELYRNMRYNLRNSCDTFKNLRCVIVDSVRKFKKLSDLVAQLRSLKNLASNASSSSNLKPEVSEFTEKRHIKISARANSSNANQYSENVANNQPKKKRNHIWRPFLPPEYDANDSKWTLKYQTNLPGLVELMPQSGIYVSFGDLKYCQVVSKDCESLARRLLTAVFNRKALSVCLSLTERARAYDNVGSNIRPELDDHACSVLLRFVLEHGTQHDWNFDLKNILRTLNCKILDIRFKYGELVRC